jgi:hypothetical protein
MGRDAIKVALKDRITSPNLNLSIVCAIQACVRCKSFGSSRLNVLLQPIIRRHPFELLVGDYLSMPPGKGGYHTIGLYLNTFSQHMWAFKYKTVGTAKTMIDVVSMVTKAYVALEMFMMDGRSHFNNAVVREYCDTNGIKQHITPAYSPWVNGLVEGSNKILLHVLKWLCTPDVGEQANTEGWEKLPKHWPDHLDDTVKALNHHILPVLKHSPKELLLGIAINTLRTEPEDAMGELSVDKAAIHMAYAVQQRLDGYEATVKHAITHKRAFDRRVLKSSGEVSFRKGNLVQIY